MRGLWILVLWGCGDDGPTTPATTPGPTSPITSEPDDDAVPAGPTRVRVATYNTALSRDNDGGLLTELRAGSDRARKVAQVLQDVRPDIVVLQEVDLEDGGILLDLLHDDYLAVGQAGLAPLDYPHRVHLAANTGLPTGLDLDGDGATDGPGDAQGFGNHPGQYAFAVLSRYPLQPTRTWRELVWADMPDNLLPADFYDADARAVLRLSSKTHAVVPVEAPGGALSLVVSHPTPPVFDGPEDRNGRRNHDEIALVTSVISNQSWLVDDAGDPGGLADTDPFVVLGDLNADPRDGDALRGALIDLLAHPRVHQQVAQGDMVPQSEGGAANNAEPGHRGDPAHDTTAWGLRVDYALPSSDLTVEATGVYWPSPPGPEEVSDHRLVWVDLLH